MTGPVTDYDPLADRYAAEVDSRPWNALYERPATLALLPPLQGLRVLDAGCGHGWYAARMADMGARVLAYDPSPRMAALAAARLAGRGEARCAKTVDIQSSEGRSSFNVILSSLVLHYVPDLAGELRSLCYLLAPGGMIVVSLHHPLMHPELLARGTYMRPAIVEARWEWLDASIRYIHRPLGEIGAAIAAAGLLIETMREPQPSPEMRASHPRAFARLSALPGFLLLRLVARP